MKIILAILLIGIILVSGCVSQAPPAGGGEPQKTGPPAFPEGGGSGKAVLPTGKATGWELPMEYPWK